ncbi:MAG: SDR family NAD(P)-dependent oxidoreductase [Paracoccaceae bacterium]|nr:SDR family NAD(P)-dependent oxidoreductase [Paracoccaceae bacterium]
MRPRRWRQTWNAPAPPSATIRDRHGGVETSVNNEGVLSNHKADGTSPQTWRRPVSVNLDGAFYTTRAQRPGMRRRRFGRVVNVFSLTMNTGRLGALPFSLARETMADVVTVDGVAPAS